MHVDVVPCCVIPLVSALKIASEIGAVDMKSNVLRDLGVVSCSIEAERYLGGVDVWWLSIRQKD